MTPSRFAELRTTQLAERMGARLPAFAIVNGCVLTPGGIRIGCAFVPPAATISADAEKMQGALLDKRSARPLSVLHRIAGAAWRWC